MFIKKTFTKKSSNYFFPISRIFNLKSMQNFAIVGQGLPELHVQMKSKLPRNHTVTIKQIFHGLCVFSTSRSPLISSRGWLGTKSIGTTPGSKEPRILDNRSWGWASSGCRHGHGHGHWRQRQTANASPWSWTTSREHLVPIWTHESTLQFLIFQFFFIVAHGIVKITRAGPIVGLLFGIPTLSQRIVTRVVSVVWAGGGNERGCPAHARPHFRGWTDSVKVSVGTNTASFGCHRNGQKFRSCPTNLTKKIKEILLVHLGFYHTGWKFKYRLATIEILIAQPRVARPVTPSQKWNAWF